jgi:glycogen(starch) synthase
VSAPWFTPVDDSAPRPRTHGVLGDRHALRVLHLGFEDPLMPGAGGGSLRTHETNRRLVGADYRVTVLTTRYPGFADGLYDGVHYVHVGYGKGRNRLTRLIGYVVGLPAAVRAHRGFDLVVEDFFPPFSSMAVPLWSGLPTVGLVQWLHAGEKARQYRLPFHLVERVAVRTHRRLIAVSVGTAERLLAMNPGAHVDVVGNGVDPALLREPPQLGRDVLFIGRLELVGKGLDLLLRAWAQACHHVDAQLVVAGSGPDEAKVRDLVRRLGISDRVRFPGWVGGREKAELLNGSRLVAVPSRQETFGMVAVEALAAATPVIAFDIPCLREVVPSDCGWLIDPFDIGAFAGQLIAVYDDAERLLRAGRRGREFAAAGFDWDLLADQQARVYDDVARERPAAAGWSAPVTARRPGVDGHLTPTTRTTGRAVMRSPSTSTAGRLSQPGAARVLSPVPRDVWREALTADRTAVPTQTPEWVDWLCRNRGFRDASRLYEFTDGRRLVLPMVSRSTAGLRVTEESMPYGFGYGGGLIAHGPTVAEIRTVLQDLTRRPVARTSLVPMPLSAGTWAGAATGAVVRVPFLAQVIDLTGGFETVWSSRYRKDTRTKVRRAERSSLDVRSGDACCVDAFAQLNRRSVLRWAQQRHQPVLLARLAERRRDRAGQLATAATELGPMCTTWSAHHAGEPVAAYATLQFGEHVIFWMSAMDRELADRTWAGYLLQSLAIEAACATGAKWFHLGESDPGSGVERFKAAFGGSSVRYDALRFERLPFTAGERRARAIAGRHFPPGGRA